MSLINEQCDWYQKRWRRVWEFSFFLVCIVFFGGSVLGADHKELLVLESAVEELKLNILWGLT